VLTLPARFMVEMIDDARDRAPREACGLVATADGIGVKLYKIANVDPSPFRYEMDPHELYCAISEIENNGWDMGAIYHSHPQSEAFPSPTDRDLAFYTEAQYFIVSLQDPTEPAVRAFKIVDSVVEEHSITLI
jgi:proteasome lid subunit RPN8/RPN11